MVPPASFPPQNTGIIVVDSLSTLLDNAYPRFREEKRSANKSDAAKWASSRKYAVLGDLLSKLEKLAALHDLTILLTCHTVTRMRPGAGALLVPAISGLEWDSSMSTRLVLFRDWPPHQFQSTNPSELERLSRLRFVGVEKAGGVSIADENSVNIVPFTIEEVSSLPRRHRPSFTRTSSSVYTDCELDRTCRSQLASCKCRHPTPNIAGTSCKAHIRGDCRLRGRRRRLG